uniref:Bestrophin homolog n=1 Tax=Noctiluca scintillans TaxID=2966 RepID=A0A7S1A5J7_NOCSC
MQTASVKKSTVIYQWISNLMDEAQRNGVLVAPPPLLTRAFNAMENGLQDYHVAMKLADTPFPFPYTAGMEVLLTVHFFLTPVITTIWTDSVFLMVLFTFFSVWSVWMLHLVAGELENPFGLDDTDLHMGEIQKDINSTLRLLFDNTCQHVPHISSGVNIDHLQHNSAHFSGLPSVVEDADARCVSSAYRPEASGPREMVMNVVTSIVMNRDA